MSHAIGSAGGRHAPLDPPIFVQLGTALPVAELVTTDARRDGERGTGLAADRARALLARSLDVVFAAVVLVVTGPVILLAAAAIRLESPGPAFFRQTRLGHRGKTFRILKLRGMYADAPARFPHLYDYDARTADGGERFYFHDGEDIRVTRVGRFVRRTSIDELPNFWNVLRGEMSVVGPRPEIPELAHLYGDSLERFLSVRPGVTSPAKAAGRDRLSFSETLAAELAYVENRSLRLDAVTVLKTIGSAFRSGDAR